MYLNYGGYFVYPVFGYVAIYMETIMTKVTGRNFAKLLSGLVTAFGSLRDSMQQLLMFAFSQYVEGNFNYLNDIVNLKTLKGLSMKSIQTYAEAHCDVTLEKDKETGVYKFESNKTRGFKYVAPKATWYDFSDEGKVTVLVPVTMLNAFIKRLEGAIAGEGKTTVAKKDVKPGKVLLTKLNLISKAA